MVADISAKNLKTRTFGIQEDAVLGVDFATHEVQEGECVVLGFDGGARVLLRTVERNVFRRNPCSRLCLFNGYSS